MPCDQFIAAQGLAVPVLAEGDRCLAALGADVPAAAGPMRHHAIGKVVGDVAELVRQLGLRAAARHLS